jgi:small nuclear ribonucleoprotein D2
MWTETPKGKNKKPVNKDRFISWVGFLKQSIKLMSRSKMFLRGDSVILGEFMYIIGYACKS